VKNRAAFQLDSIGVFQGQRDEVVVQHAAPAVQKADELIAIVVDALFHSRINHRIQSGAIAAAGQQSNSHCTISSSVSPGRADVLGAGRAGSNSLNFLKPAVYAAARQFRRTRRLIQCTPSL
jgi:hypothetical protein